MIPGIEIEMGGRAWTVPPLTLGHLRRLGPEITTMRTDRLMTDPEVVGAVIKVVTAALQRNYPEVTEDVVADMLDIANAPAVFMAVMTGSGLRRAEAMGEAAAATGNGTSFTGSLPPRSDIASETLTN